MKKSYILLLAAASILSSCKMDVLPEGSIADTEALISAKDYANFTNGLYTQMRYVTSGDMVILSDIQLDDFHALITNGNRRMDFYNGSFTSITGEISSIYARYYAAIAETNFLINKAEGKLNDTNLSEIEKSIIQRSLGEALLFRAYCYNELANKFCASYKNSQETLDLEGKGLSLQLTYDPTTDNSKYPGRSSLRNTYKQITDDLNNSEFYITEFEKIAADDKRAIELKSELHSLGQDTTMLLPDKNNYRVSSDAVKAMKARVYLNMGEDKLAYEYASNIIETGRYPLTSESKFAELWTYDKGDEVIWCVQSELNYHGSASGSAFRNNSAPPDYIPTNDSYWLYDDNDIRCQTWFIECNGDNDGKITTWAFNKYPGNPSLYTGQYSNFMNMSKPFRSAELYLICAEALLNMNDISHSKKYMDDITNNRKSYKTYLTATGEDYVNEVREERHRELMGEGFRLADLKRWNIGCKRGTPLNGESSIIVKNFMDKEYVANDIRFTWPIPQHEIDSNPQINKQQNPGY